MDAHAIAKHMQSRIKKFKVSRFESDQDIVTVAQLQYWGCWRYVSEQKIIRLLRATHGVSPTVYR